MLMDVLRIRTDGAATEIKRAGAAILRHLFPDIISKDEAAAANDVSALVAAEWVAVYTAPGVSETHV
jgi:hypothetical protein